MIRVTIGICILLLAALLGVAFGHDTWLMAAQTKVKPNTTVTFDLTSGMAFPALDVGPKRERIQGAYYRLNNQSSDMTDIIAGEKSLQFKTKLSETGVATIWVKLPARRIELKPEEVKEYLDEVSAPESLRRQWAEMKEPKRWRELYTKHPKTFVRVGDPISDNSWNKPIGIFLEIVPEIDPTSLKDGDDFPIRVLKDGKPFADFALNAVTGGDKKGETRRTDHDGKVTFKMNKTGRWLLRGTDIRKSDQAETDYESDFATLTLEVSEK